MANVGSVGGVGGVTVEAGVTVEVVSKVWDV